MSERINPTEMQSFAARASDGPVVMLNLINLRPDGGAENYQNYMAAVSPLLAAAEGEAIYVGRGAELLIGREDENWDLVLLVRYPTRKHLLAMVTSTAYAEIQHLRDDSLSRSVLLATDPTLPTDSG